VAGDDITTVRPGAKYLWLMYVRQRTKWVSSKVSGVDGRSDPFVIALKNGITNRMPKIISFCKIHNTFLFSQ